MSISGNVKSSRRIQIIITFLVATIFIVLTATMMSKPKPDTYEVNDDIAPGSAALQESTQLLALLKNDSILYAGISQDVGTFAIKTIDKYQTDTPRVIFKLDEKLDKKADTINFSGKYDGNKDKINVQLKLLAHGKMHTSITNSADDTNIDSQLPSNTLRNQFIGSLPKTEPEYTLDYNESTDGFIITLSNGGNAAIKKSALQALMSGAGKTDLTTEKFEVVVPPSAGEGVPLIP